jgi:diguanylate cyclase (GGDEF)-like protein
MWDTILSGKTFVGILTNRRKNGQLFEVFHTVTPLEDHNRRITHFVATSKDITAHRQLEERNHYLAYYDGLTGLANRSLLTDRVKQAIARAEHHEQLAGVAFIDVDRFHLINDVFGAALGDRLLKETARRLSEYVREGDTAARLGSDEYAVLFNDLARSEDIIFLLEELMEVLSEPITTEDKQTILTFSIGVSVYPNDTRDSESLLQNADMACQQAKAGGGNTYRFFTRTMNLSASEFIAMEHRMKSALSNHDFVLHYQPYWDIHTRKMVGMEALIRCQNPDGEMIPPGRFIPVLEKTGLIIEVGEWVIREAIRQIGAWQKAGYALLPVSINLSPIQFRQKDLTSIIQKELIEHGVSPFQFAAEITESAFMEDLEYTRSMLQSLREAGLSISIDDFGTGYSSLSYLKKLPVDNLKIDISFIRELGLDPDAEPIVAAIVTMAKALNLKTIAEGVETEDQWEFLRHLGCDTVQGFFMSPPLPADKVERLFS